MTESTDRPAPDGPAVNPYSQGPESVGPPAATPSTPFRVSLKWWLISLVVLGAATGLMGRLWMYNFEVFLGTLAVGSIAVPFLIALTTLVVLGFKRRQQQASWIGLPLLAVGLLITPVIGLAIVGAIAWQRENSPSPYLATSTGYLIHTELPKDFDYNSEVWDELQRRADSGDLTADQASQVASMFLDHMQDEQSGWDETVSYQSGFLATSLKKHLVAKPVIETICDEYYGQTPTIRLLGQTDSDDQRLRFAIGMGSELGETTGAPFDVAINLVELRVNGAVVAFDTGISEADEYSDEYCQRFYRCELPANAAASGPAGGSGVVLAADLELAYVDSTWDVYDYDGPTLNALSHAQPPEIHRQWRATVTHEVAAAAPELEHQPPTLVTDPARDPGVGEALQVESVRVWQAGDNRSRIELAGWWSPTNYGCFGEDAVAACAFEATLEVDGRSIKLAPGLANDMDDNEYEWEPFLLTAEIDPLPTGVQEAELVLTPTLELLQDDPNVIEVWGQTEKFPAVPLTRLDLEAFDDPQPEATDE